MVQTASSFNCTLASSANGHCLICVCVCVVNREWNTQWAWITNRASLKSCPPSTLVCDCFLVMLGLFFASLGIFEMVCGCIRHVSVFTCKLVIPSTLFLCVATTQLPQGTRLDRARNGWLLAKSIQNPQGRVIQGFKLFILLYRKLHQLHSSWFGH